MRQIEKNIEARLTSLRTDDDEPSRLQRKIHDEKRAAMKIVMESPGYKPFVELNQAQVRPPTRDERRRPLPCRSLL